MSARKERILIICKTYPSPSARYSETSCVAGISEAGKLLRLYPVPFRLIENKRQFKKWQWIRAVIKRAADDRRPESHRIYVDTIETGPFIPSSDDWTHRRPWLHKLPLFGDFSALEALRASSGWPTLALLRPARLVGLDITPVANSDWTDEEKAKILMLQQQGNLFEETERDLRLLRKLPFDFHYRYVCISEEGPKTYRHKIVDWEIGALYWNVHRIHGTNWETPFRAKIEGQLPSQDLVFLMGTIHRFPDQWLIVSLIYPPKRAKDAPSQGLLFPE
ncbi:MAG: hypothetical protein DIU71_01895 [Proteobacteria bacterium]|nr:MAG: hypothetical protein DIU71_01895 [Pseudomonadota bacterium]